MLGKQSSRSARATAIAQGPGSHARYVQQPGGAVRAGQRHPCQRVGDVGAREQFLGDVRQPLVGILSEAGDADAQHAVLAVVRKDVRPGGSE